MHKQFSEYNLILSVALCIRCPPAVLRHAFLSRDHNMQRLRQLTFASLEHDFKKLKKRREIFLERMDGLIP